MTGTLQPDREELSLFIEALFAHAAEGGKVLLRAFFDDERARKNNDPPFRTVTATINGEGPGSILELAYKVACDAASEERPVVLCPPICTFTRAKADEKSLREGLVLSVELDERAAAAVARLRAIIGPPTLVVESGGEWTDPVTGKAEPKLHVHWRLKEPTSTLEEHARLKRARTLACELVGADATAKTIVHPLRWAGTWHRKNPKVPKLARIVEHNPEAEIVLEDALAEFEGLVALRGMAEPGQRHSGMSPAGSERLLLACAELIANPDLAWPAWNRLGMAFWRASGGSEAGFAAFDIVSRKSAKCDPAATRARWHHYGTAPPSSLGIGTLIREAQQGDDTFMRPPPPEYDGPESREDLLPPEEEGEEPKPKPADGWPEPIDIFAEQMPGAITIDETCVPATVLRFARSEGTRLCVDPAALAAAALAICSGVISDDWQVRLKEHDTWSEQPRLWVGIVAVPGQKKTDQLRSAKRPVDLIEAEMRKRYFAAHASFEERHRAWKKLPKKERDGQEEPKPPTLERVGTQDATIEAYSELLKQNRKVLVLLDELLTFFAAFDRYSGGKASSGRAHALSLYEGGPRQIDRIGRGHVFCPNWSAAVVGGIQPDKLREMIKDLSTDGLLQRFLLVYPARVVPDNKDDDDRPSDREALQAYELLVHTLAALKPPERDGGGYLQVRATTEAKPHRRRLFDLVERIEQDPSLPAALRETVSKWRGLLARLALVFHCIGLAEGGKDTVTLAPATVEMAANFIRRVVTPSTFRLYREMGLEGEPAVRLVASHILAKGLVQATARDIGRGCRELRGDLPGIVRTMEVLEHVGWVRGDHHPRTPSWEMNPTLHQTFAARAKEEREHLERVQQLLAIKLSELVG